MPKRLLEDMVKARPSRKEVVEEKLQKIRQEPRQEKIRENKELGEIGTNHGRSGYMLWFVALISVIFCFFALSFLFSKAEVVANPKTQDIILNESLSAVKNSDTNDLSFDLMVISDEENTTIQVSGEKDVSEKATGTVVIYNAFGSSSQTLNIDTRLEGSNGKMYKTKTRVVVPGRSKDGVPGSVEVDIYAAEAGVEYNSGPLDFKIFGFKGTPKYDKFYARSKGEITGGFKGKTPAITDIDRTTAVGNLNDILQKKLLQKATSQIPDGFILFKDAIFLNTDDLSVSSVYDNNSATLTLKGTLYGILFNEQKLTKKITEDKIEKYDESEVYVPNIKNLAFSLFTKDNVSFENVKNINFNLSGPAKIVWKLDVDKFVTSLLGKPKKDFNQILSQYPDIDSAILTLSPVWKMSVPDKAKNIKVIINYPE
ncbi:hypothetical protein A2740_02745 [Candidatus Nomurabacteria bacterium RIFCSPHIGHO2_01_FULL_43_16]|nr:MAG: hypothetical protein A2740_02745 [Candidatus Nomurabacteria bacterium RIFCSPHIGHO2_01_FULL_43_16]OGI97932.1 MAG: hypothetical protein A3A11_00165 [Candidatus Nomurabacteria bacterium RIFCSPLOWO2_01_FULL_43_15]